MQKRVDFYVMLSLEFFNLKIEFMRKLFVKFTITKFYKNPGMYFQFVSCLQTEGPVY
jgi:hypothetical protein